ncbi:DsbA family protein [Euzebya tangerina]|uniref:mycothiol-dependent nitroreductase Rv2466c family protein n=1 Tax=Euzebya tangerina TaxID=591198 RepID=UPI0013C307B4|nr:DsbA family protein [Euzebya tangerina]
MQVRFYFDPLCPWCWVTSFWLDDEVRPHRDIEIDWRPISLKVRNEGKEIDPEYREKVQPAMNRSFALLRIVEALRKDGKTDQIRAVYKEFGTHFHHADDGLDFDVTEALTAAGVDASYAEYMDDSSLDEAVRASTAEAEDVAGDDVGTPIIAYEVDGEWKGYFGPVIPSVPTGDAALTLWDGLSALIEVDGFYELKRTRNEGPDMSSIQL